MKDESVQLIPVGSIVPNPFQPRRHFDQQALAELAASIKEKGILQPIVVRKSNGKDNFELVVGERRFRACQSLGMTTIPSIIRVLDDNETREIALIENLQREGLNPIEEAESVRALVVISSQEAVAQKLGKSLQYIQDRLVLSTLPTSVQDRIRRGEVNIAQAKVIAVINPSKQEEAATLAHRLNLTANQLKGRMQKHLASKGKKNSAEGSGSAKVKGPSAVTKLLVRVQEALSAMDIATFTEEKRRNILKKQLSLVKATIDEKLKELG